MTSRKPVLFLTLFVTLGCGGAREETNATESPNDSSSGDEMTHTERDSRVHHPHHHAGGHHGFADAERFAEIFDHPDRREWQRPDFVVARLELEPGMHVADLGAGTGFFLSYLATAVGAEGLVLALDTEASMVEYMRERASREELSNVEVRQVGPTDPGLEGVRIDRILVVDTWHHIEARVEYARKLQQALPTGGSVMIVDFTLDADPGPPVEMRLAPETVRDELQAAGFEATIIDEPLPHQYIVVGTK